MSTDLKDTLDVVLERLRIGEPLPVILADHAAEAAALRPLLLTAEALKAIRPVEMPSPEALLADRDKFLEEVLQLQTQAVSSGQLERLEEWIVHYLPWQSLNLTYPWKEHRRMSTLLIKVTLIFGLVFGSVGGTAVLAADSLPDSPIYPVKLVIEQTRLAMTSEPADLAVLHMSLAQVRTQEMEQLALADKVPPEATLARLRLHVNQALNLAAQIPDDESMLGLLSQAQQMIQTQQQQLAQTQARIAVPAQAALGQANALLDQVGQEIEAGLQDPQTFRWRYRHGDDRPPEPSCDRGDCDPEGNQNQNRNQIQNNPRPEPPGGSCNGEDCPMQGNQNQNQNQHQYGPQDNQPDGSCDNGDCAPSHEQDRDRDQEHKGDKVQDQIQDQDQDRDQVRDRDQDQTQEQEQLLDQEQIRDRDRDWLQDRDQSHKQAQDGSASDSSASGSVTGNDSGGQNSEQDAADGLPGSEGGGSDNSGGNSDNGGNGGGNGDGNKGGGNKGGGKEG